MLDLISLLNTIHRPRLLIRAARFGMTDYKRNVHLRRLLGTPHLPRNGEAVIRLIELEAEYNDQRKENAAEYSPSRHAEILIALMAEAQILRAGTSAEPAPA